MSSEVMGGIAPVAAREPGDELREEILDVPIVATLKPSPDPDGRETVVLGTAVVFGWAWCEAVESLWRWFFR